MKLKQKTVVHKTEYEETAGGPLVKDTYTTQEIDLEGVLIGLQKQIDILLAHVDLRTQAKPVLKKARKGVFEDE